MKIEYLLLVASSLMSTSSSFFSKKYAQLTGKGGISTNLIFIFGSAVISMISFWLMAGGNLVFNNSILIFSILSGLIYNAANLINLFAYRNINLVLISVFGKSSTVTTWLLGILFFSEIPTAGNIISVIIITISFFLPLIDLKRSPGDLRITYIIGTLQLLISTLNTLILRSFLNLPFIDAAATSSLLFFACSFMTIPPIIIMLAHILKDSSKVKEELKTFTLPMLLCIVAVNLFSNPSSLLSTLAMKGIPLLDYSILSSAIGSIFLFISSKLLFKEKVGKITIIALILSTIASVINVI